MSKITILVSEKQANPALRQLRRVGTVHVTHMRKPVADRITSLKHRVDVLDKVISIAGDSPDQKGDLAADNLAQYENDVLKLDKEKRSTLHSLKDLEKKRQWFMTWGFVSLSSLADLRKSGIFVKFYKFHKSYLKLVSPDKVVYVVNRDGSEVYAVFLTEDKEDSLGAPEIFPPHEDFHLLDRKISDAKQELKRINEKLSFFGCYRKCFIHYRNEFIKKNQFYQVRFGMASEEGICCLEGFCPKNRVSEIVKCADKEGWGIITRDPDVPEEVPTLIKNPKWIDIIKPVFKFMATVPGYGEYDISFFFLCFFSIFFAMLIGDGGYGVLFFLAAFFLRKKFPEAPPALFSLTYILAGATVVWGAVSGTWFGFEKIGRLPFLSYLVIPRLDSFVEGNRLFLMQMCFVIGAVQLTFAHGIVAFRHINSLFALSQAGWIFIIWGILFLAGNLVIGSPFPEFAKYLFAAGVILVVLFSNPRKNILKGIAVSIADLPLKIISSFGDTLSYLRLFVVGYATVEVAVSFNQMAMSVGFNNFFKSMAAVLILIAGHALNITLGLLSVLVHGIRLNMLEFSGHMDMQWAGKEYKPFKE